jgi:hypothetical protein
MFNHSGRASGSSGTWFKPELVTFYSGDIRQPWRSTHGFPMTAGRLAAGQRMVLVCREDEVQDDITKLNRLLGSPESLNRACTLLEQADNRTRQKFARLVKIQAQAISDEETAELVAAAENLLTSPSRQTVIERLACLLTPDNPTRSTVGLGKTLVLLWQVIAALDKYKDNGFQVEVTAKRRQPLRLDRAARHQALTIEKQQYHLTLWEYLVARCGTGILNQQRL